MKFDSKPSRPREADDFVEPRATVPRIVLPRAFGHGGFPGWGPKVG
jgi:hypothetical protein